MLLTKVEKAHTLKIVNRLTKSQYELKTACMVPVYKYKYKYVKKGFGGVTRYYAEAYGNNGVQSWFFENSL